MWSILVRWLHYQDIPRQKLLLCHIYGSRFPQPANLAANTLLSTRLRKSPGQGILAGRFLLKLRAIKRDDCPTPPHVQTFRPRGEYATALSH